MMRIVRTLLAALALYAGPAFAQGYTATLPVTCKGATGDCIRAMPVVNPDGTFISAGGGGGGGAVTVADGADVTQGAKADSPYAGSGSASVIAALKGLYAAQAATTTAIGTPLQAGGTIVATQATATNLNVQAIIAPTAAANNGLTTVNAAGATSNVLKSSAGNVYSLNIVNSTVAGFVILYDAASAPTSGTALTTASIRYCFPVAASAALDKVFQMPVATSTGSVLLASTSCTTYTALGTAPVIMIGQVK